MNSNNKFWPTLAPKKRIGGELQAWTSESAPDSAGGRIQGTWDPESESELIIPKGAVGYLWEWH